MLLRHDKHTSPERDGPEIVNAQVLQLVSGQAQGLSRASFGPTMTLRLLHVKGEAQYRPKSPLMPTCARVSGQLATQRFSRR